MAERVGACLPPEVVAEFAAGRLLASSAERVELHVDGCAECRALVAAAARADRAP